MPKTIITNGLLKSIGGFLSDLLLEGTATGSPSAPVGLHSI